MSDENCSKKNIEKQEKLQIIREKQIEKQNSIREKNKQYNDEKQKNKQEQIEKFNIKKEIFEVNGAPGGTRTPNQRIMSPLL